MSTFSDVFNFFRSSRDQVGNLAGIGIASFGPLELDPSASNYGHLLVTPKAGWTNFDVRGEIAREFGLPIGINTDVNAAGLAETRWGAGRSSVCLVYLTIGTGIGGSIIYQRAPLVGLTHTEIGHVYVRKHPLDQDYPGVCCFHGDCIEGLASGPAILARTGKSLDEIAPDDPMWEMEADYLGQLCAYLVNTAAPSRIILGGGVMQQARLFPAIRSRMRHWLAGYCQRAEPMREDYICPPALGSRSGVKGALVLAIEAAQRNG